MPPLSAWWRRGRVELPVQKSFTRSFYRLSRPLYLAPPPSADRLRRSQPVSLRQPLPASGLQHLGFSAPYPARRGEARESVAALVRLPVRIRVRQLLLCHLISEVDGHLGLRLRDSTPLSSHTSPLCPLATTVSSLPGPSCSSLVASGARRRASRWLRACRKTSCRAQAPAPPLLSHP